MKNSFTFSEARHLEFIQKENPAPFYIEVDILNTWSGVSAKKYVEMKKINNVNI